MWVDANKEFEISIPYTMLIGGGQSLYATAFFGENVAAAQEDGIIAIADVLEWRHIDEDGKLYRRLYDRTKGEWVTEWELWP